MGLFAKLIETKCCNVCGEAIPFAKGKKIVGGICCDLCYDKLSPYYPDSLRKHATVDDIKYQIECREQSRIRLNEFDISRKIGKETKVFIDEGKGWFYILPSAKDQKRNIIPDVIDCKAVTNITIDIKEHRKEMKYRDSNGEVKSFNPPCYACAYDFYLDIDTKIPYISSMRVKLNGSRVDNGQPNIITMNDGSLLSRFTDALLPAKSYKGKTSNADEVQESSQYRMYEALASEIKETILSFRQVKDSRRADTKKCPWCNMYVLEKQLNCNHCGGPLA